MPEPERATWAMAPLEGVGPLRFGMPLSEVRAALPDAVELDRFQADPWGSAVLDVQFGIRPAAPTVCAYFTEDDQLYCVAADAALGPRVTLEGLELTGRVPEEIERALLDIAESTDFGMSYGPRGNPGVNRIGLVLRVQETGRGVLSRPVLVGRAWADRCVDDYESLIPKCEWVGRQWPHPGHPGVWPSADDAPPWSGAWCPPF